MNEKNQVALSVKRERDFVLQLFMLYVTPLCVYLQSLFFATTNAWGAIYIAMIVGLMVISGKIAVRVKKTDALLFVFMMIVCFSSFTVGDYMFFLQAFLVLVFVWGYTKYDLGDLYKYLDIILVFGVACAIACMIQELWNGFYTDIISKLFKAQEVETVLRLEVDMGNCGLMPQTGTAAGCILNAFYVLCLKHYPRKKKFILGAVLILGLLLTGKRAHLFMGLFVFFLSFFVGYGGKQKSKKILIGIVTAIIFGGGLIAITPFLPEDNTIAKGANTILHFNLEDDEIMHGRQLLYAEAIIMGNSNPLKGQGWGSFKKLVDYHGGNTDVHNVYLQLYAEMGIVVAACFLMAAVVLIITNIKLIKKARSKYDEDSEVVSLTKVSFCFILFFFLYCLTGNPLYNVECLIVLGLGVSINKKVQQLIKE